MFEEKKHEHAPHDEPVSAHNDELQHYKTKLAQAEERFVYLTADFENFRRNTIKERASWMRTAQIKVFTDIVAIVDDFDRVMQDLNTAQNLSESEKSRLKGIDLIYKMFLKFLEKNHITEIPTTIPFNPQQHEALMQVEESGKDSGTIIQVLQKGYTYHDTIIRPAQVSVAK